MKLEFSRQIFEKQSSNIKFHPNSCSGSRAVPCGQTDMTKLIVVFRNFANAPEMYRTIFKFVEHVKDCIGVCMSVCVALLQLVHLYRILLTVYNFIKFR